MFAFTRLATSCASFVRCASSKSKRAPARNTVKPVDSRKTFLVDKYTTLLRRSPVILVCHNNALQKQENLRTRSKIEDAGGKLMVTRANLFNVALRGLDAEDPAAVKKPSVNTPNPHPLSKLFYGPTAVVAFKELNPQAVEKVIKLLDRSGERLMLLGGLVDGQTLDRQQVDDFKTLPTLEQLRAQLTGVLSVLGGAGLVQTLEASQKMLYLTMDERRRMLDPDAKKDDESE